MSSCLALWFSPCFCLSVSVSSPLQGLSLNPELMDGLSDYIGWSWTPPTSAFATVTSVTIPGFYVGPGDPNSGPHACTANT